VVAADRRMVMLEHRTHSVGEQQARHMVEGSGHHNHHMEVRGTQEGLASPTAEVVVDI